MLSDVTNEKIKYANCGENRELLIDEIIRIGILDVSGNPIAGCKERICELYKSQPLSQKEFGEKLNALFAPNGYNPVMGFKTCSGSTACTAETECFRLG